MSFFSISEVYPPKLKTEEKRLHLTYNNVDKYNEAIQDSGLLVPKGPCYLIDLHHLTQGALLYAVFQHPPQRGHVCEVSLPSSIREGVFCGCRLWSNVYTRWLALQQCHIRCSPADLGGEHAFHPEVTIVF